jgi:hypothetical protein
MSPKAIWAVQVMSGKKQSPYLEYLYIFPEHKASEGYMIANFNEEIHLFKNN